MTWLKEQGYRRNCCDTGPSAKGALPLDGAPQVDDFDRCIAAIQEEVGKDGKPLPDRVVKGLCATLHKVATGASPGHAPGEGGKG